MTPEQREAHRREADAKNGCAMKAKPAGDPRALVLAALPGTRQEIRAKTGLSNADTKAALSSLLRAGAVTTVGGEYRGR